MTSTDKFDGTDRMTNDALKAETASRDAAMLAAICKELDHKSATLDGATLSRLHQIRSAAVSARSPRLQRFLIPIGGLVTVGALVVALDLGWGVHKAETGNPSQMEAMEILSANETLDFYDDYDFYQWLADK